MEASSQQPTVSTVFVYSLSFLILLLFFILNVYHYSFNIVIFIINSSYFFGGFTLHVNISQWDPPKWASIIYANEPPSGKMSTYLRKAIVLVEVEGKSRAHLNAFCRKRELVMLVSVGETDVPEDMEHVQSIFRRWLNPATPEMEDDGLTADPAVMATTSGSPADCPHPSMGEGNGDSDEDRQPSQMSRLDALLLEAAASGHSTDIHRLWRAGADVNIAGIFGRRNKLLKGIVIQTLHVPDELISSHYDKRHQPCSELLIGLGVLFFINIMSTPVNYLSLLIKIIAVMWHYRYCNI